jgi:hypothetical protein
VIAPLDWSLYPLGRKRDAEIAKMAGVGKDAVARARIRLGIKRMDEPKRASAPNRWQPYSRCDGCGVDAGRACRTAEDEIAAEPCAWRPLRKQRPKVRARKRRQPAAPPPAPDPIVVSALDALDQHVRLMASLITELKRVRTQKEG